MTAVLSPPNIRSQELLTVAALDNGQGLEMPYSRELESAVVEVRKLLDEEEIRRLSFAAQFLLRTELPSFDADRSYNEETLSGILVALDQLQGGLREMVESLSEKSIAIHPRVRELRLAVLDAAARLFDFSEELRWAVMNAQAERDISSGGVKSFGSMSAAINYLKRMP